MRKSDPRVPSGALNDGSAGLDQSLLFGFFDEVERGTVLDGTSGVHELGFAVDIAAGLVAELVEAY